MSLKDDFQTFISNLEPNNMDEMETTVDPPGISERFT